jgi:TonB-linked SusC/RagA family outer membrane protein
MKKKRTGKCVLTMKIILFLMACLLVQARASVSAQQARVSVTMENVSLRELFKELGKQAGHAFLYNHQLVKSRGNVTVTATGEQLSSVLDALLPALGLEYLFRDNVWIIRERESSPRLPQRQRVVTGKVTDKASSPLPGVTVTIKGTRQGTATGADGQFSLVIPATGDIVLQFSFVGMEPVEVKYTGQESLDITLQEIVSELDDVIVTGIFTRRKESFTGSAQTFTREQLRKVGNTNLVQSLKNIDPSFYIVENLVDGSNPNVMPEIQLRGQSGFPDLREEYQTNPNQPLFILDGFEVELAKVIDLDMNRVESVTLLKDAAAKAIYGSKAANGVVVIETVRPEAGRMQVSYNGSLNLSIPDLTSYNLCNAAEKLELEVATGRYYSESVREYHYTRKELYNKHLNNVISGVDTDWKSKPSRTGAGQRHALSLTGGDEYFRYGINVSYNNVKGVMKGSDRNTLSGDFSFSYRYKALSIRNNLNVNYNLANNSPWGTFDQYVKMNPYLRYTDENGKILKIVGTIPFTFVTVYNPMWNATISTRDISEYTQVTNNTYVELLPVAGLRLTGRLGVTRNNNRNETFRPQSHTDFISTEYTRRGRYTQGNGYSSSLSTDANASYSKRWSNHLFFVNAGWSLNSSVSRSMTVMAEGFPNDRMDDISFARQYVQGTRPSSSESTVRDLGVLGALNYSYADRYLFDASYRASASSQFGRENRWGSFWSIGIGWNLHHESFMKNVTFLQQLKLRASIGYTGSQNFNSYQSKSTYSYTMESAYNSHIGALLLGIENEQLKWQRKYDRNIGTDIALLHGVLSLRADYYSSYTSDLLTNVTVPSSTGFLSFKENLGETENKGYELQASIRVWSDQKNRNFVNLYFAASHNENRVRKISNSLNTFNKEQVKSVTNLVKPIVRYTEGQSMSTIWVVPSKGIDPATGKEVFVRQDGTLTYTWSDLDLSACGDTEPTLKGNCGFNADYKGFSLNVGMTWRFGGQVYNQTLVDKVENADVNYNVDRRVFSERWRKPGDVTLYKSASSVGDTRATQRFVEDMNEWVLSSVNFSYDFDEFAAIKSTGIHRFHLSFNMNDVARISSVKMERGTAYPFAREFSFSLQAMF